MGAGETGWEGTRNTELQKVKYTTHVHGIQSLFIWLRLLKMLFLPVADWEIKAQP